MPDPETTTLDLLRHAECEGGDIFRGALDVPLSDAGWVRLRRITAPVAGWDHIVTSPMKRCHAFAQELAAERDIELSVDERFREWSLGAWEGVAKSDIRRDQPDRLDGWRADPEANPAPNGEPIAAVRERVAAALSDLLAAHCGRYLLLVAHGGVIRTLVGNVLDLPLAATNRLDMPYACRSRLCVTHGRFGDRPRLMGHNLDDA